MQTILQPSLGHISLINEAAFSHDTDKIITGSADNTAIIWDMHTGRMLRRLIGHKRDVKTVDFSLDDHYALTGSNDGTIRLWNTVNGAELTSITCDNGDKILSVRFIANDDLIVALSDRGVMRVYSAKADYCRLNLVKKFNASTLPTSRDTSLPENTPVQFPIGLTKEP